MIYITGDTHARFERVELFCKENNTSKDDILIFASINETNKDILSSCSSYHSFFSQIGHFLFDVKLSSIKLI